MGLPQDYYLSTLSELRTELLQLKNCQITFLASAVGATGAILGLAESLQKNPDLGSVSLYPLIVIIPSWWSFFDKATTITRIVGYKRILERLVLEKNCASANFLGFECALAKFRERQLQGLLHAEQAIRAADYLNVLRQIVSRKSTNRYWGISYLTFLSLSVLCVVIAGTTSGVKEQKLVVAGVALLVVVTAWWNLWLSAHLIHGRFSYDSNECFWECIMKVHPRRLPNHCCCESQEDLAHAGFSSGVG